MRTTAASRRKCVSTCEGFRAHEVKLQLCRHSVTYIFGVVCHSIQSPVLNTLWKYNFTVTISIDRLIRQILHAYICVVLPLASKSHHVSLLGCVDSRKRFLLPRIRKCHSRDSRAARIGIRYDFQRHRLRQ